MLLCLALPLSVGAATGQMTVTAINRLPFARASQTLEFSAAQLAPLGAKALNTIHVKDAAGRELVCQAVDTDGDALLKPDIVIFQSDFGAGETRTFTVSAGRKQEFAPEQFRAYGRFVRERFDDFAWENDRIAHRTYGRALETWQAEPLAASPIDIWSKRTARMVINDWYMAEHYHADSGEGADFYSAGKSRGCGGNGLWAADRLWTSRNFTNSRMLANGPIRVMFELDYEPFDVNGCKVAEVKRITLDAGSQLGRFQSFYKSEKPGALTCGIGIRKLPDDRMEFDGTTGTLAGWQKMEHNAGGQGVAVVVAPNPALRQVEDTLNHLVLAPCDPDNTVSCWAGFAWDRAGRIADAAAWKKYVGEFAQGLRTPIAVVIGGDVRP